MESSGKHNFFKKLLKVSRYILPLPMDFGHASLGIGDVLDVSKSISFINNLFSQLLISYRS